VGETAYTIARDLNKDAVPTAQGRTSTTRTRISSLNSPQPEKLMPM
jgi:hypothetical protein